MHDRVKDFPKEKKIGGNGVLNGFWSLKEGWLKV